MCLEGLSMLGHGTREREQMNNQEIEKSRVADLDPLVFI
jgi:hypothetical protein